MTILTVNRGYGSCAGGSGSPAPAPDPSTSSSPGKQQSDTDSGQTGGGCTVQANEQCGGKAFTGCTSCASGMQCTFFNDCKSSNSLHDPQSVALIFSSGWSDCKPGGVISRVRRGFAHRQMF